VPIHHQTMSLIVMLEGTLTVQRPAFTDFAQLRLTRSTTPLSANCTYAKPLTIPLGLQRFQATHNFGPRFESVWAHHLLESRAIARLFWLRRRALAFGDDPDCVDDPRNIAEQGQQDIQPESAGETDLQKHPERRQQDGDKYADQVHEVTPF
jgi:hypothetical protein